MGQITELVRRLRKNQTPEEKALWKELRGKKLNGCKFLRQQPIIYETMPKRKFFVADFYCHEKGLVIELDGKIHDYQKDYDENRDEILTALGLRVVRFRNDELKSLERVLEQIRNLLV